MDKKHIEDFAQIPQIPQEKWGFIDDIKSPLSYIFDDSRACDAKENSECLANGINLVFDKKLSVPETALISLDRVLEAKKIEKNPAGKPSCPSGYPHVPYGRISGVHLLEKCQSYSGKNDHGKICFF